MITLTLEENQIFENGEVISDLSSFLKRFSPHREMTILLKTHAASYHHCPIRKAVPYMKSAEFSSDHWVGERGLAKGQTFLGGILPTPFMRHMIHLISEHSFGLKGVFVWADLMTQAYGPLPSGWSIILHDQNLLICQDQILKFSRPCYLSFAEELPAILRYLKRFGYEAEKPILLLTSSAIADVLPPFVQCEIRTTQSLIPQGLNFQIPELNNHLRLYFWPRNIRKAAYILALFNFLGIAYFSWQIKAVFEQEYILKHQMSLMPSHNPLNEIKMAAFADYRRLSKDRPNPLSLIRDLPPLMKDEAVATYLHWTPNSLTLHLELNPSTEAEKFFLTLRSHFDDYQMTWKNDENEPLKGILTMEKKTPHRMES
jgi:hypothetical protein